MIIGLEYVTSMKLHSHLYVVPKNYAFIIECFSHHHEYLVFVASLHEANGMTYEYGMAY